jgi:hypothetical protein
VIIRKTQLTAAFWHRRLVPREVPALGTYDTMQQPHDFTSLVELYPRVFSAVNASMLSYTQDTSSRLKTCKLINMRDLRFWQKCSWRFSSTTIWCYVNGQVLPYVSQDCTALSSGSEQFDPEEQGSTILHNVIQWHSITSHMIYRVFIFSQHDVKKYGKSGNVLLVRKYETRKYNWDGIC